MFTENFLLEAWAGRLQIVSFIIVSCSFIKHCQVLYLYVNMMT